MDQFFQWDAEGTLGTTRRYSLSLRTSVAAPREAGPGGGSLSKLARLNKKVAQFFLCTLYS